MQATAGALISAHSHWDVHQYRDHEIKVCYEVLGKTTDAGKMIAHLPFREVNSANFMDLRILTNGFRLDRVVNSVYVTMTPDPSVPNPNLVIGVGSQVMFDLVMVGPQYDLYALNPDLSRGAHWYRWTDSTYPTGVNVSYYTVKRWSGVWDFVLAAPLDATGYPHQISGLFQDARNHPAVGSEGTFDDATPASGAVQGIVGGSATFGLPSGTNYEYSITTSGAGAAIFDFRDPALNGTHWKNSWYRLVLGVHPTIQRYVGSTASTKFYATAGGGAGTYRLRLIGPDIYLLDSVGSVLLHVNDGGPQSGVRVRVNPRTQTVNWSGVVQ